MWIKNKPINRPFGNGKHNIYKHGDDWGMVYGIVLPTFIAHNMPEKCSSIVGQKAQLAKIVKAAHLALSDSEVPPDSTGLSLCPLLYPLFTGQKLRGCTSLSEMAQDLTVRFPICIHTYIYNMCIYIYTYICIYIYVIYHPKKIPDPGRAAPCSSSG